MTEMHDEINIDGMILRMGSLPLPEDYVCCTPPFASSVEVWEDSDIRRVLADENRMPAREEFDPKIWKMNQYSTRACNGYAGANGLAKTRKRRGIQDNRRFSGAYLYSLMNGGRDGGSALVDGMALLEERGCCYFETVPWRNIYRGSYNASIADREASKHRGLNLLAIESLQELKTALARNMLCIVAVQADYNFMKLTNGISGVDNGQGNHAITLQDIRFKDGFFQYDHDGSWGTGLLEEGNSWLVDDHFRQTIRTHQFYALASTTEID